MNKSVSYFNKSLNFNTDKLISKTNLLFINKIVLLIILTFNFIINFYLLIEFFRSNNFFQLEIFIIIM